MKKTLRTLIVVFLFVSFALGLASCSKKEENENKPLVIENITFEKEDGFSENEDISVTEIDVATDKTIVPTIRNMLNSKLISEDAPLAVYTISSSIKGSAFTPEIAVTMTLPAPIEGADKYALYRIDANGTIEAIDTELDDGKLSAEVILGSKAHFVFAEAEGYKVKVTGGNFVKVLPIIGQSLLGVFGAIAFIILVIYLLNKGAAAFDKKIKKDDKK